MLMNFCQNQFEPIIECFQMESEGFEAKNLSKNFSENNGFLCDPLQRPVVDVFLRFPLNFDLEKIVFSPTIGRHRSTVVEFSTSRETIDEENSWLIEPSRKKPLGNVRFQRVAFVFNEDSSVQKIEIRKKLDETSTSNVAIFPFCSSTNLTNCSSMKISIRRTLRHSSVALKFLQIWATPSVSISAAIREKISVFFPKKIEENPKKTSNDEKLDEPTEFLDALTNDLMLIPMILPSGFIVDRSTLEKCLAEDHRWSRNPRDPFTLIPFDSTTQPVVAQNLKMRIDQFLSEHQDEPKYRRYGRVLDPSNKRKRSDE